MLIKRRSSTRARFAARLMAVLAASAPIAINAADITVVTDADSGVGSLRQAMLDAVAGDRILFDPSLSGSTISLNSMLPVIDQDLTIVGDGAPNLVIDGAGTNRVFFVQSGSVEISELTIRNGAAIGGAGGSGGVGGGGGGLGAGGAIFVDSTAVVTISALTIEDSSAVGGAGGTYQPLSDGGSGGGGGLGGDGGDGGVGTGTGGGGGGGGLNGAGGDGGELGGGGGGGIDGVGGTGDGSDGTGTESGGGGGGTGAGGAGTGTAGSGGSGNSTIGGGGGGGGTGGTNGFDADAGAGLNGGGGTGGVGGGGGGAGQLSEASAGSAGDFGGGGGASDGSTLDAGSGGFGGGGGGGNDAGSTGGNGGFGGGGGASVMPGAAGDWGGQGGTAGGGGGGALGGAIFVRSGGSLIIQDTGLTGSSVTAGAGSGNGASGTTAGDGVFLHNVDLSIDVTEGTAVTIADVISDNSPVGGAASSVTKTGGGTLTLEAANTFAGNTNINAGVLQLNGSLAGGASVSAGATLTGVGTVAGAVTSNGTLAAGNGIGTLSFGSGLTVNGGTVDVELDDAGTTAGVNNDLYDVTGAATINGGTVNVIAADGTYSDGLEYTFLTAAGGLTGTFAGVTDNLVFFDTVLAYDATSARLVFTEVTFDQLGGTCNQIAIGGYLESLESTATGDLANVLAAVGNASSVAAVQRSLDQLGGQIYPTLASAQVQHTSTNLAMIRDEVAFNVPRLASGQRCAGWVRGYGIGGHTTQDDCGTSGYDYRTGGTEMALLTGVGRPFMMGIFANFAWSDIDLNTVDQGGTVNSYQFGGLLEYIGHYGYTLGMFGAGVQEYDVTRQINSVGLNRTAKSEFDGNQSFVYLEQGTVVDARTWAWMPHVALQYVQVDQDGFVETGANSVNLVGQSVDAESLRGFLGVSVEQTAPISGGLATTRLRTGWVHEYLDTEYFFTSRYASASESVTLVGNDPGRDWCAVSASTRIALGPHWSLLGNYQGQYNSHQAVNAGAGGIELVW